MSDTLSRELETFEKIKPALLAAHKGQFALIHDDQLIGTFQTDEAALEEGARKFGLETYLVRPITEAQEEIHIPALTWGLLNAHL